MRIIAYGIGKMRTIDTCLLDYSTSHIMLADDFLSMVDFEKNGITLERGAHTTYDEGLMALKPEPVQIFSPKELLEIDEITVDGLSFAAKDGDGHLRPCLLSGLSDENGDLKIPNANGMRIYYRSGSYGSIDKTLLTYAEGNVIEDDQIEFDAVEAKGIRWDRGVWTTSDAELMSLRPTQCVLLDPQELKAVYLVTFCNQIAYQAATVPQNETGEDKLD